MHKKFTRQAVNALKLAKLTAQSCKHTYIGTEHILVGLLKEKEGTAGRILEEFGVDIQKLLELIGNLIAPSDVVVLIKYNMRQDILVTSRINNKENYKQNIM